MKSKKAGKFICLLTILTMSISVNACSFRNNTEHGENAADSEAAGNESIAVANFYTMQMPSEVTNNPTTHYAVNDEYLYYTYGFYKEEETGTLTQVVRKRITDGYTEEDYIVSPKNRSEVTDQILLADAEGCCLFWESIAMAKEEEDVAYALEKYGAEGELLWHKDYTSEKFQDVGSDLSQGIITADGRIFLYTYGEGGMVFSFSALGQLDGTYIPELESLEGVAEGTDGRVYAYCVTGEQPVFSEIEDEGRTYVCPLLPLQVYSGNGNGIYLRDGEGMWRYEPETGETEMLWGWEDEYVQIDGSFVDSIYQSDRGCMLMCIEPNPRNHSFHIRDSFTFAMITPADSRDYPGLQAVTLAINYSDEQIDKMVKLYNRHSRKYRIEIVEADSETLYTKLIRGEGPDLVNINDYYAENLTAMGAFEDLMPYFEASEIVAAEDILEPARQACTIRGQLTGVMPAFWIETLLAKETWHPWEEWDVWNFLEMAQENRMFRNQSPYYILQRCMGIRFGEYFIDWEKKECHFDSEEFRRCLEACRNCESYVDDHSDNVVQSFGDRQGEDGWLFVEGTKLRRVWDLISEPNPFSSYWGDPEYSAKMIGFPGWDGGEYELKAEGIFAINSASKNKEGAWDFLEYLMSEEYQSLINTAFPTRKDSFEIYLNDLYDSTRIIIYSDETGEPIDYAPTEKDIIRMREMVNAAVYNNWLGKLNPVRDIINEEADMYFAGDATLDETVDKIQNRMQLYLDEH